MYVRTRVDIIVNIVGELRSVPGIGSMLVTGALLQAPGA